MSESRGRNPSRGRPGEPSRWLDLVRVAVTEPAPPEASVLRASALSALLPPAMDWFDRAKAVFATLVDSGEAFPALAGARSGSSTRHMEFQAGAVRVEIEVDEIDDSHWELHGQVADVREPAGGVVALLRPSQFEPTAIGRIDQRGYFRLAAAAGDYEIAIGLPSSTILLPACHLP